MVFPKPVDMHAGKLALAHKSKICDDEHIRKTVFLSFSEENTLNVWANNLTDIITKKKIDLLVPLGL